MNKRYDEMTLAEVKLEIEQHLQDRLNDMDGELLTHLDVADGYDVVKRMAAAYTNLVHALHEARHGDLPYCELYGADENAVPKVPGDKGDGAE